MNRQYEFVVLGISQPASSSTSHSKSKESRKTSSSSKYNNILIEHDHLIFTRFYTKMTSVKFRISTEFAAKQLNKMIYYRIRGLIQLIDPWQINISSRKINSDMLSPKRWSRKCVKSNTWGSKSNSFRVFHGFR